MSPTPRLRAVIPSGIGSTESISARCKATILFRNWKELENGRNDNIVTSGLFMPFPDDR